MKPSVSRRWWFEESDGLAYRTRLGRAYQGRIEDFLLTAASKSIRGQVDLLLTSPPFPLLKPKRYGNEVGNAYMEWLTSLARPLASLLSPRGSLVLEIGNAWEKGAPEMSTVPLETLIAFKRAGDLRLCQQFVCHNTARLPSPAQWVTVKRIRVKDSYTHVWWFSRSISPRANNRRVLQPYSPAMRSLISRGRYNAGERPSEHGIGAETFLRDNGGAIPSSVLAFSGTGSQREYQAWCANQGVRPHPARMQSKLAEFFIKFLTSPNALVFDPFAGSNTTGWIAEKLGRRWVGVERDAEYLHGSIGRFTTLDQSTEGPKLGRH